MDKIRQGAAAIKEKMSPHSGTRNTTGYPEETGKGAYQTGGGVNQGYQTGGGHTQTQTYQTTAEVPVEVQQTTTTDYATTASGDVQTARQGEAAVCAQEYFTKTEDRPIVKERVEFLKEHRPVEKEFVVETRATGVEREVLEGRAVEHLGTQERIVSVTPPKSPCE